MDDEHLSQMGDYRLAKGPREEAERELWRMFSKVEGSMSEELMAERRYASIAEYGRGDPSRASEAD